MLKLHESTLIFNAQENVGRKEKEKKYKKGEIKYIELSFVADQS